MTSTSLYWFDSHVNCTCMREKEAGGGEGRRGGGEPNSISCFSLGMSSSLSLHASLLLPLSLFVSLQHPQSSTSLSLSPSITHPSIAFSIMPQPLPLSSFPALSLPHSSLHPLFLSWGLAGPVQGAEAAAVCVCRPLFTLIIGIGSVLFGFQSTSTGTSLNQSWKQESCEANLTTCTCPNISHIYSFRQ